MKKFLEIIKFIIIISILYGIFTLLGIGCPIKFLTGVSCPGCGMTRAFLSLLRGDINRAFYYHPLWIGIVIYGIVLVLKLLNSKKKIIEKIYNMVFLLLVICFIITYFYRMFYGNGDIVLFNLRSGIIFRILNYIF